MKIAILTPSFFPVRGGTEQLTYEVAKRIAQKNKAVIITPNLKKVKKCEVIDGIKVYRFPLINFPLLNVLTSQLALLFYLPRILKKENIDLLHMYHVFPLGGAAVIAKWLRKIPFIAHPIGWDTYDPIRSTPKLLWPYMAWVMNSADTVLTSCKSMVNYAKRQGCKKKIGIIPHGTNMLHTKFKKIDIRKKYDLSKNTKIIFSLQRLFPRKGLPYLIKAVKQVVQESKKTKFIIGGKGPEKTKLQRLARKLNVEKHIIFAGFIPDEELKNYYQQADLFTLPSLYEGFGIVYVDALVNGLPVVATKCGGPEDIVNENNGFLVPTKNSKALAKAINTALHKKWNKKKIRNEAKKYDWENIYKKYEQVYKTILKRNKNPNRSRAPGIFKVRSGFNTSAKHQGIKPIGTNKKWK